MESLLREKAAEESREGKALCTFVGVRVTGDEHEEIGARGEAVFAFAGVYESPKHTQPYLVSMSVQHALYNKRRVPRHPLRIPTNLDGLRSGGPKAGGAPEGAPARPRDMRDTLADLARWQHVEELQQRQKKRELDKLNLNSIRMCIVLE